MDTYDREVAILNKLVAQFPLVTGVNGERMDERVYIHDFVNIFEINCRANDIEVPKQDILAFCCFLGLDGKPCMSPEQFLKHYSDTYRSPSEMIDAVERITDAIIILCNRIRLPIDGKSSTEL